MKLKCGVTAVPLFTGYVTEPNFGINCDDKNAPAYEFKTSAKTHAYTGCQQNPIIIYAYELF